MILSRQLTVAVFLLCLAVAGRGDEPADSAGPEEIARRTRKRMESMALYFKGQKIFESQCVPCHGVTGKGNGPWSATLKDKPRNFRSGIFKFRTTPFGKLPTDDDLKRTIRSGVSGTAMPTFQKKLTDAELDGLVVYLQNFSRRWHDPSLYARPIPLPDPPGWLTREDSSRENHVASGAALFGQLCASCHGAEGKGDGLAAKSLRDVWEQPITPADLTRPHHKSGDKTQDLYRTIATGLDGTPMVGFHGVLTADQIWELVAFVRSLEKQRAGSQP